ncbi:unnamed protein product, partial [Mesorhabditis belari]|uniref:C-type lectin domain-containing protein n=1 Tax=Mesorhabditis belari TaxID=2138241 RepID=A0AAF3E9A6_9BILA
MFIGLLHGFNKTFNDAEDFCQTFDGHLASIHSNDENQYIKDLTYSKECLTSVNGYNQGTTVLGGQLAANNKTAFWVDETEADYTGITCYHGGEPNTILMNSFPADCGRCPDGICAGDLNRLRPLIAILFYLIFCVIFSANPSRIKWRPVIGGFILQISFGLLVLRWPSGQRGLHFISNKIVGFLDFTTAGTIFNFNFIASPPNICGMGYVFFFTSLQIVIYFAVFVSILNYFRVIEFVLSRIAVMMQYTMGTTAAESLNAVACIFVGQTEAAILIGPSLGTMTESEIHSVMTAGFACIAGSLFSAYISFGAQPAYLLSATVMNATVSLGISKMVYPEMQKSRQKKANSFKFDTHKNKSLPQLMYEAACHASRLVINIDNANLIVYIALLAFLNDAVGYFGDLVGITDLSFNKLLGYLFFPFAYLMGVSDVENHEIQVEESFRVAELMGIKTFLNEFIAYQKLKEMVVAGSLKGARAQMIATYALCGFSNISMIGSQLGILGSLCPWRKGIFAKVVVRALFSGCISCFITASIAGNETIIETDGLRKEPIITRPIGNRITEGNSEELPEYTTKKYDSSTRTPSTDNEEISIESSTGEDWQSTSSFSNSTASPSQLTTTVSSLKNPLKTIPPFVSQKQEVIDKCNSLEIDANSCPVSIANADNSDFNETDVVDGGFSGFKPLHYNVSLLVRSIQDLELSGSVRLHLEAINPSNKIVLHMGDGLRLVNDKSLKVISCSKEKVICVTNIHHDHQKSILRVVLSEEVSSGDNIRIDIDQFYSKNAISLFMQRPGYTKAPEMLGTQMQIGGARRIFPSIDLPTFKSPFILCVSHPSTFNVRSNMKRQINDGDSMKTCFVQTLPLATHQIAFVVSQNAYSKVFNSSSFDFPQTPDLEVLFSQAEKNINKLLEARWLPDEVARMISTMREWTGVGYPLDRLTIASAPLIGPHGTATGGLGLIILPATAIEHEKHLRSHTHLLRAVIGQWIGGIVGPRSNHDLCLQEALIGYLEAKVHEDIKITPIVNRTRVKSLAEIEKSKNLEARNTRALTPEQTMHICGEKGMTLFYSLDETFGPNTVLGMLKLVFAQHSFDYASANDYAKALEAQTRSRTAGELLKKWFRSSSPPIVLLKVQSNEIMVTQPSSDSWEMPIEIAGSTGVQLIDIKGNESIPYQSTDYVIADPKRRSVAFVGYDLETYLRLMRCWDDSRCPANKDDLKGLFKDFGALLLNKYIMDSNKANGGRWKELFQFLVTQKLLQGDQACCATYAVNPQAPTDGRCFFVVKDVCSKVDLIEKVAHQ